MNTFIHNYDMCIFFQTLPREEIAYAEFSTPHETYTFDPRRMSALSHLEEPMVHAQIETCSKMIDGDVTQETPLLNGHHHQESTV